MFVALEVQILGGGNAGPLQAYVFGEYRDICSEGFDNTDANVACVILGYA